MTDTLPVPQDSWAMIPSENPKASPLSPITPQGRDNDFLQIEISGSRKEASIHTKVGEALL